MSLTAWFLENSEWTVPLTITFLFSVINIIFAILNVINSKAQYKGQQITIAISLMQKRMEVYYIERSVLEAIIEYTKPIQKQIEALCRADLEARFLFGDDVREHLKAVLNLVERSRGHKKAIISDGEGGFFDSAHDYEEEVLSQDASGLYGESIELYSRYIDFSDIGTTGKEKRRKK